MFAGVGERTREGNDLYKEMIESGVIKLGAEASQSKCTLVYGQMNEPPGARARVGLTGKFCTVRLALRFGWCLTIYFNGPRYAEDSI